MKTVLVTGGAGYIGSVVVAELAHHGYRVRVLDRFLWGRDHLSAWLPQVELINADIRTFDGAVLDGVEAVVHLAGLSNDPTANFDPEASWEINALATERLANLCLAHGVPRLTYGSSCSVYDGLDDAGELDETVAVNPRGAYSRSKYYGEEALLSRACSSFAPVVLRQGTVFSTSPRLRLDLVLNTFVKDAIVQRKLFLHGGGLMWRPLVAVADVAEAHRLCLEADAGGVAGEIFNVVHGNVQMRELALLVAAATRRRGAPIEIEVVDGRPASRNYRCANTKLRDRIGYEPPTTIREGVESMLDVLDHGDRTRWMHPRYYNIDWMMLLKEISAVVECAYPLRVLGSQPEQVAEPMGTWS